MGGHSKALQLEKPRLDALVEQHADVLRAMARRLCRDATEAEDLVQDTLERALANAASFTPGTNVRAWLLAILNHLFIDRCRQRARQGPHLQVEQLEHELPEVLPDVEPRWAKLGKPDVEKALLALEPAFRDVYKLHLEGRSYEQISSALDVPRATVGTRLLRARAKLKALLFPDEEAA